MNKRKGRPPPDWLFKLEPGEYTIREVTKMSKKTPANVARILNKYCTIVRVERLENFNVLKNIYFWDGKIREPLDFSIPVT